MTTVAEPAEDSERAYFYFPLYGLRHGDASCAERGRMSEVSGPWSAMFPDPDDAHLCSLGQGACLAKPSADDWCFLERTEVALENLTCYGNQVPHAIVVASRAVDGDIGPPWRLAQELASDLVVALRLRKAGVFVDPVYAGLYAEHGHQSTRLPSLYRQSFFGESFEPGYFFTEEDRAPVVALAGLLRAVRRGAPDPALRLAVENFRFAGSPYMPEAATVLMLFTSMEAMLGGFGEVVAGERLAERAAVGASETADKDPDVREFVAGPGRLLRNSLAHDDLDSGAVGDAIAMLQRVLRPVLRRYLRFRANPVLASEWPSAEGAPRPLTSFRTLLSDASKGNAGARRRLLALD